MTAARHTARVAAWVVLVCVCLIPIGALLAASVTTRPRPPATTTTTSTTTTVATVTTAAPVTVQPGSLTEANDVGDATFVPARPAARGVWRTASTFYCLPGSTADGSRVAAGIVAVSYADWPRLRGTSWKVTVGPADLVGRVFTVHDKGPRARFDMWTGDCVYAGRYGRHTITVIPA